MSGAPSPSSSSSSSSSSSGTPSSFVVADKYHVLGPLGQGGMGVVYDAIHAKTGRRVALKLIHEHAIAGSPAARRRFEREARAAGAIDSLHVVQVLDSGEDERSGMPFLVMELLDGCDLRTALRDRGATCPFSPSIAVAIAIQACMGLKKAHEAEIIHRDLKPPNVFLARTDGDRRIVKILDFGIAKLVDGAAAEGTVDLTTTGDVIGSPPYMSPEQLSSPRDVDHRTDLWALGVVLYEMLSGQTPTHGITPIGARVYAICHQPSPPITNLVPDLPAPLAAIVHRALALRPADRFASASEMLDALRAVFPEDDADVIPEHVFAGGGAAPRQRAATRPSSSSPPMFAPSAIVPEETITTTTTPPPDRKRRRMVVVIAAALLGAAALSILGGVAANRVITQAHSQNARSTALPSASFSPSPSGPAVAASSSSSSSSLSGEDPVALPSVAVPAVTATPAAAPSPTTPRRPPSIRTRRDGSPVPRPSSSGNGREQM